LALVVGLTLRAAPLTFVAVLAVVRRGVVFFEVVVVRRRGVFQLGIVLFSIGRRTRFAQSNNNNRVEPTIGAANTLLKQKILPHFTDYPCRGIVQTA